jgi:hypothetical protein
MDRKLICVVPILIAASLLSGGVLLDPVVAQPPVQPDHPRMRAALNELREARKDLKAAKDDRPAGYKERALEAMNDAIEALRINLAIENVDTLKGLDRNPDYYTKFTDRPRLRSAILDLRHARIELESNLANLRDPKDRELRERALDNIDIALGHILVLIRDGKK